MIEIIIGSILIAFGVLSLYFSIEEGVKDTKLMFILVLGVACIVGGSWLLITKLTLGLILQKLAGLVLAGVGLFLIIGFPDIKDYQGFGMSRAGILIGLIILIIGIWWLLF